MCSSLHLRRRPFGYGGGCLAARDRASRRGLTRCELGALVFVALLLLHPALSFLTRTVDKARTRGCRENLKSIYDATFAYRLDHNERLPGPVGKGTNWEFVGPNGCSGCFQKYQAGEVEGSGPRYEPFYKYQRNRRVWRCPSVGSFRSYGWCRGLDWRNAQRVRYPARTVMFADSWATAPGDIAWIPHAFEDAKTDRDCCGGYSSRRELWDAHPHWVSTIHQGGANVCFLEGHVEWIDIKNIPRGRQGTYTINGEEQAIYFHADCQ